jgi:hypothetical protein
MSLEGESRLFVLRLVFLRKCGRFHEPEPKQRHEPEPCARAVRYSVGSAVCTHWQQSPRASAARIVWTHLKNEVLLLNGCCEKSKLPWKKKSLCNRPTIITAVGTLSEHNLTVLHRCCLYEMKSIEPWWGILWICWKCEEFYKNESILQ